VQIAPGSLLVAHPAHADKSARKHVVLITESTKLGTMGLTLNQPNQHHLSDLLLEKGFNWPLSDTLYTGGYYNPGSLVLLHSSEWSSSSTMPIANDWAISSDVLMLEKLEQYNTPNDYRIFLGCAGWKSHELSIELNDRAPQWIVMYNPSTSLIMADPEDQWDLALMECSHNAVDSWL
jgi:putative transcriptional regulator